MEQHKTKLKHRTFFTTGVLIFCVHTDEALMCLASRLFCRFSVISSDGRVGWTFFDNQIMGEHRFSKFLFCFEKWIFIKHFFKHSLWRCIGDVDEEAHGSRKWHSGAHECSSRARWWVEIWFWTLRHGFDIRAVFRNLVYDRIHNGYEYSTDSNFVWVLS